MAKPSKTPAKADDKQFKEVVQHFLNTPHKPHKPKKDKKQEKER